MLTILINWTYIGGITLIVGSACMQALTKAFRSDYRYGIFHMVFAGIMVTTCYAQIFSLFTGVGLLANVILLLFCLCYLIMGKGSIRQVFSGFGSDGTPVIRTRIGILVAVIAVICFALASSGPAKLIDTDWYHAQTIRWIEEYGCVKGIANLFTSLGFNSSQHYFDALFSMKFLFGQSMKGTGGFFGLLLFLHGWSRLVKVRKSGGHIADAMAVAEIVYVIIITAFFTDPYTDTLPNCLSFFILTEWIALLEEKEADVFPYAYLCILAVFATVVKTSAVIMILLVIQPAVILIKHKEWKKIIGYLVIGIAVAVPFFLTNIRTSGYLVYLASGVDLFDVPWKIDVEILKHSVDSMIHDARGVNKTMEEVMNAGLTWIPDWFRNDSLSHQILYLAILAVMVFDWTMIIINLVKRQKQDGKMLLVRGVVYLSLIYWLMTIPQVKYCWAYLLAPLALVPAYYLRHMQGRLRWLVWGSGALAAGVLLMYTAFYSYRTMGYIRTAIPDYLIWQADYERHEMKPVKKDSHTFFVREEEGDILCGYYVFPYLHDEEILESLVVGESLRDGFYLK